MPRPRAISSRQLDLLIQLMEHNGDLANGRPGGGPGGPAAHRQINRYWAYVASRLNSVADGATKNSNSWKKYWNELKYRAKKRALEVRASRQASGGARPLSSTEERVLAIMEAGAGAYHQGLLDVQIHVQPSSPAPSAQESPPPTPLPSPAATHHTSQEVPLLPSPPDQAMRPDEGSADPPPWARNYEERRLAIEEANAATLRRIADAVERLCEVLTRPADPEAKSTTLTPPR